LPLVGSTLEFGHDPLAFYIRLQRDYGDVVSFSQLGKRKYVVYHPEQVAPVLKQHNLFVKNIPDNFMGQGLITSDGDVWKRDRKLMAPFFTLQEVKRYGLMSVELTQALLAGWNVGEKRDVHADMMHLTLQVACKSLFDVDVSGVADHIRLALSEIQEYYSHPVNFMTFAAKVPFLPAQSRFHKAVKELDGIVFNLIAERRKQAASGQDLMSKLIALHDDSGSGMTDQWLRDQLVTMIFVGHDTTALSLTYALYLLATHPEVQAKWQAELDAVLGGRLPTPEDEPKLPYTQWVIRETMRLYPVVWCGYREAAEDTELGGYPVPKGQRVYIVQWVTHRDGRWYENPESFQPERWDNDLIKKLPQGAYFPFADGGARVCIGNIFAQLEMTMILAAIGQRFHLSSVPDYKLDLQAAVTLQPRGGMPLQITGRS
jgi:cytochrome P450